VDKADRTEVEVVTHCDELQVNKANRKEVDIVSYIAETAIFLLMVPCLGIDDGTGLKMNR
jgi:hypothetical protein